MVERVRERVPGVAFRTSFIVGFPGETDAEFEELLGFVREAEFDHLGVFTFSDEEGTTSFDLPGPGARRASRSVGAAGCWPQQKRISHAPEQAARRRARRGAGRGRPRRTRTCCCGAGWPRRRPTSTAAVIINDGTRRAGSFVTCEITEAHPYDLVARIV